MREGNRNFLGLNRRSNIVDVRFLPMSARCPALATSPGPGFCNFSRASDICNRECTELRQALTALHRKLNSLANDATSLGVLSKHSLWSIGKGLSEAGLLCYVRRTLCVSMRFLQK